MYSLSEFLSKSTCAATAVITIEEELKEKGFEELSQSQPWDMKEGGAYYVKVRDTSILAFRVGSMNNTEGTPFFRIVGGHTDQPTFKLKPEPELQTGASSKLNVSVYGGPIFYSWMDRPLSLAGRVVLKGKTPFENIPMTVDLKKPLLVIPSLAIHMNREVNKGAELNPQVDLQPLAGLELKDDFIRSLLIDHLNALDGEKTYGPEDLLDYELYCYNLDQPTVTGLKGEFLCSPRLDDLVMVKAGLDAILKIVPERGITVLAALDNEEIGSRTPQGGNSQTVSFLLEKAAACFGLDRLAFLDALVSSFMLSGDVAHAVHPNHKEMHDSKVFPVLGGGPVIKMDAGQRYMTNAADFSVFAQLCKENGIPYQSFISRADKVSGSTLGPVMSAFLPCRIVDIGTPILSMHSALETFAIADYDSTEKAYEAFYRF